MKKVLTKICIYDGVTLFVKDPAFIEFLLDFPEKFNLEPSYNQEDKLIHLEGRYKNFTLRMGHNSKVYGVIIGGSLHKFFNGSNNCEPFYWHEFLQAYRLLLDAFELDPAEVDIWTLEGGLNNYFKHLEDDQVKEIIEDVLLLKKKPKDNREKRYPKKGIMRLFVIGECDYKIYAKSAQCKAELAALRTECKCKSKKLKIFGFNKLKDLLNEEAHENYRIHLIESFKTLIIFQREVLRHPDLNSDDRDFLNKFSSARAWFELKRVRKQYQYKLAVRRYEKLIDKFCVQNHKKNIIDSMNSYF